MTAPHLHQSHPVSCSDQWPEASRTRNSHLGSDRASASVTSAASEKKPSGGIKHSLEKWISCRFSHENVVMSHLQGLSIATCNFWSVVVSNSMRTFFRLIQPNEKSGPRKTVVPLGHAEEQQWISLLNFRRINRLVYRSV